MPFGELSSGNYTSKTFTCTEPQLEVGNPSSKWVWYHVWDWAQVTVPPIMEVDSKALNNKNLVSKMIIFHFHELPQGGPLPVINRVMNYNCMYRGHNPSYIPIYSRPFIVGKKQHVFFFCIYPALPQTWRFVKKTSLKHDPTPRRFGSLEAESDGRYPEVAAR